MTVARWAREAHQDEDGWALIIHELCAFDPARVRATEETSLYTDVARAYLYQCATREGLGWRVDPGK